MRPTLRQMQYIIAVADAGRFGEAARRLNVSQPSLSSQIAEVEASLDSVLFERSPGGALLTQKGEEFVRRARLVLRHVEDLRAAMQSEGSTLSGRIRLGVLPTIGPYLLPSAVRRLHELYPDLKLGIRDERSIDLENGLADGRFDIVISTALDHPGRRCMPLFREDLYVCVSLDDPLAAETGPLGVADLRGRTLMNLGFGHRLSILVQRIADLAGAHMSTEYEGTSLDALRQMAVMGTGVAILPSLYALLEARRDTSITLRRIDHPVAMRNIVLAWRESSPLSDTYALLGEVLVDVANRQLAS